MAKPEDFLDQAIRLLKVAAGDLDYRVVIDRAYYAAFHAAREFEEKLPQRSGAAISHTGSHEGLLQCLERPNSKLDYGLSIISKDIGAQMRMLKPLREIASYELHEKVHVDQAEAAIEGAKDVLAECKKGMRKLTTP